MAFRSSFPTSAFASISYHSSFRNDCNLPISVLMMSIISYDYNDFKFSVSCRQTAFQTRNEHHCYHINYPIRRHARIASTMNAINVINAFIIRLMITIDRIERIQQYAVYYSGDFLFACHSFPIMFPLCSMIAW